MTSTEHEQELAVKATKWKQRLDATLRILVIMAVITTMVTTGFVVWSLVELQRLSKNSNELNQLTVTISERLQDCTTPGGSCYEQSRSGSSGAIRDINNITIAAAACADREGVDTVADIRKCIEDTLKP